ncbi:MAG TPA: 50S ribosomal protein L29 [Oceanipulchritudo sp.]|nr:50S ribosomal protein L29 [Oceanipulchritudo sp.]
MALDTKHIAELSRAEIEKKIRDVRHELLELRLKKKTGQLEKSHLLKELRRDVARLETFASRKRRETA